MDNMCQQPDRDCAEMQCGYPMPCPYHTVIIEKGISKLPSDFPASVVLLDKVFLLASATLVIG